MNIDEQMKLWEERSNDPFGTVLKSIRDLTKDYFPYDEDENGIESSPISWYIASYSVDGNRAHTLRCLKATLDNYDILGNDEGVDSLIKELENLI